MRERERDRETERETERGRNYKSRYRFWHKKNVSENLGVKRDCPLFPTVSLHGNAKNSCH